MRAVLYARFSSEELQTAKSITDQMHVCRRHAAAIGAEVAGEYIDEGISGASMANRPGVQRLLADARARRFDVVIAEDLDRLSRSDIDTLTLFDDLEALGVGISTPADQTVQRLHASLKGMVNGVFLKQLASKVRRGHEGVVRSGRIVAAPPYGYRPVIRHDAAGDRIKGLCEPDPATAPVVVRIFEDFARGLSPEKIAAALNAEGVPAPKGGLWNAPHIRGFRKATAGMLHNELYRGVFVYGRSRHVKDRRTARVRRVVQPEAERVRREMPALRIVSEDLWARVKARQAQTALTMVGRPENARRPKRLLSGLVVCGCCGHTMTAHGGGSRGQYPSYACRSREQRGPDACTMNRRPRCPDVEGRVVEALRTRLLHPELIEDAVREYHRLKHAEAKAAARGRAETEREHAEATRRAQRLIDQVEEGMPWSAVAERHAQLEARKGELQGRLDAMDAPEVLTVHPAAGAKYRAAIELLATALARPHADVTEAREAFRTIVRRVTVHPLPAYAAYELAIDFDLGDLLAPAVGRLRLNGNPQVAGFWLE